MTKVFLVEDEVIVRNGIKRNIHWDEEGFVFAGEAGDGELAWPLIKKTRPDILITDIRMPFMDGLELSSLVRKELPDTKIIILSGYGEFEYAKKAITLGVTEYLLKPINSEKLMEAVKRVAEIIEKEQREKALLEQYRKERKEDIRLEEKRLFDRLVTRSGSTAELLNAGQFLGIDLTAAFYQVVLFKAFTSQEDQEYSKQIVEVSGALQEMVSGMEHVLSFERPPEGWAFLIKGESREAVERQEREMEAYLENMLKDYGELHYFGGVGECVQRMRDISVSYQTASKAFAGRFFSGKNEFHRVGENEAPRVQPGKDMSLDAVDSSKIDRKLLEEFLKSGVSEETEDFVEEYFQNIGEANYKSLMFCHYLIVDMNFCACHFLEGLDIDTAQLPEECRDVNQYSYYASSPEGMKEYAKRLFSETLRLRDRSAGKRYRDIIEDAKAYIRQNFQDNEFSLNQAAAMVNISSSYFSTLFRQETGMTFIEYLTTLRLDKAKELLMCTDLRSSEIGYEVGYKDSHYFSYIFKKIIGCTPKEYRAGKREG